MENIQTMMDHKWTIDGPQMDHGWTIGPGPQIDNVQTIDRPMQTIDTNKQTINRLQMDHKQISFLRLCTKLSFTFSFKIIIYNISTLKTTLQSCVNLLYDLKIHSHNFQYLNLTLLLYGGVYITPPTKKWQLLLKIVILKSPNFVTFPIYL